MICPLYRGCPLFGESAIRGFTVHPLNITEMEICTIGTGKFVSSSGAGLSVKF